MHFTTRHEKTTEKTTSPYDDLELKKCFPWLEISTPFCPQSWKWEENNSAVHLMAPRGENAVVVQGLPVKFHEAFTGKTNTSNVYTDIQLAKVKVG